MHIPYTVIDGRIYLNRYPAQGEQSGTVDPAVLIHGMDGDLYQMAGDAITPKSLALQETIIIERQREIMWERIKDERTLRNAGGIKVGTLWFHSDEISRGQHLGLTIAGMQALSAGGTMETVVNPVPWKTLSGEEVILTVGLVFQVFQTGMMLTGQNFTAAKAHKAAMSASADPLAYDYSTGWPERYEK